MTKFLILSFLILSSCGYQPLYTNKNSENLTFNKINLIGNKTINRKIVSVLNFTEKDSNYSYDELALSSKKNIRVTSRNDKGQATSYNQTVEALIIFKRDDKIIKQKSFIVDFSYNTKDNKFDLAEHEKQVENNLVDEVIEKLIIYINL